MIFGAGAIGSVYAGKLALAGHCVSVLARNERLKELEINGLLLSENGKKIVKTGATVISEMLFNDLILLAEDKGYYLSELKKLSTLSRV